MEAKMNKKTRENLLIKWTGILGLLVLLACILPGYSRPTFDKSRDILLMQYDAGGDEDDIHCMAAYACMKLHSDLAGVNDYIVTGARRKYVSGTEGHPVMEYNFGSEGPEWTSAFRDWNLSVDRVRDLVKPVLQAGGRAWVAEGGQSDFTSDWIRALINDGVAASTIRDNVVVVQHSVANENFATDADLAYTKANSDYYKIADGNSGGNGTAGYATYSTNFLDDAISNSNPNAEARAIWNQTNTFLSTEDIHNPYMKVGGVDFSDTSELWWILELGADLAQGHSHSWQLPLVAQFPRRNPDRGHGAVAGQNRQSSSIKFVSLVDLPHHHFSLRCMC